jgi:DNA-binding GntR family transcriptional regulator
MPLPEERPLAGRRLLREDAQLALRGLIVDGVLAPGEVLRDGAIADWLGCSRTPVREALGRLHDIGLVEMAPNRFTRVAPLDIAQAADAHRLMALLEGELVTTLSVASGQIETLAADADRFTWALWREDHPEAFAAEQAFHAALRDGAPPRPALLRLVDSTEPVARRAQRWAWRAVCSNWPVDAHADLLDAVRAGDGERARTALAIEWETVGALVSS